MNIEVLDCTLRDGGYCNEWDFGNDNIKYIVEKLTEAKVDIIELGFLSDKKVETDNNSIFRSIKKIKEFIPAEKRDIKFMCMCNFGEVDFEKLEPSSETGIDGIRLAFHKKEWKEALSVCPIIKEKGYALYVQPMVTMMYSDMELISLIEASNEIMPEAFYIVDSFGSVRREDMLRMYYLINHSLDKAIKIGFHSHNNMQLSYANSQRFAEIYDDRDKVIDSSVFGMGRGAGNLNTEIFVEYLNKCHEKDYVIYPLLQIIDNVLNKIYSEQYWGYSLPHYLSSKYNCHPNYATYLSNKNTLTIAAINEVLSRIPENERVNYNKKLIEEIYVNYQSDEYDDVEDLLTIKERYEGKNVVILAPGSTLQKYENEVNAKIEALNAKTISVNFLPKHTKVDTVFISNKKRIEQFGKEFEKQSVCLIHTSNIHIKDIDNSYCVNYQSLRNDTVGVEDNATLMLLYLLIKVGVKQVYVAGLDGYYEYSSKNYYDSNMAMNSDREFLETMNAGIKTELDKLSEVISIEMITPSVLWKGKN